ncbi:hypothetical protein CLOM_g9230 [Closterium sp. NIES-68]|nr:hypothetical protein CLOM_g9230 [Closterium sp. NIES-68]GJP61404.1 hypothetical protein CLOP_g18572 [Closterium sp. NIES-67]
MAAGSMKSVLTQQIPRLESTFESHDNFMTSGFRFDSLRRICSGGKYVSVERPSLCSSISVSRRKSFRFGPARASSSNSPQSPSPSASAPKENHQQQQPLQPLQPLQQQKSDVTQSIGSSREGDATQARPGSEDATHFSWPTLLACLFVAGFALGPPLDGIHSVVGLQVYDVNGGLMIGGPDGLYTSVWVFPLLGAMYAVVGGLQLLIDQLALGSGPQHSALGAPSSASPEDRSAPASWFSLASSPPKGSWLRLLSCMGVLISLLHFSSLLFEAESIPSTVIFAILAVCAHANWLAFDRTLPGYLLAWFVALGAPASEVLIMKYFGIWHYTQPDIFIAGEGLVSWTAWCYFFYTQWVATVARTFAASLTPNSPALDELRW